MKILILVHSQTGTTRRMGEQLMARLQQKGNEVDLIPLETDSPVKPASVRQAPTFSITNLPDSTKYDVILAGGPVWAFSASPVIAAGIKGLGNLKGKKFLPFVTMVFFHPAMGGKQAIAFMSQTAAAVGATVLPGQIVPKMFRNVKALTEKAVAEIVEELSK